jgi:hypothetical protein
MKARGRRPWVTDQPLGASAFTCSRNDGHVSHSYSWRVPRLHTQTKFGSSATMTQCCASSPASPGLGADSVDESGEVVYADRIRLFCNHDSAVPPYQRRPRARCSINEVHKHTVYFSTTEGMRGVVVTALPMITHRQEVKCSIP